PTDERRTAVALFDAIEERIDVNRRISETLEAIARAQFKSWFVDFDPVHAKAESRNPGLPEYIADLFPNRFENSESGKIPMGWRMETVGEHLANFDSKRIPVSGAQRAGRQGLYPYHGAAGVMDYVDV